MFNIITNQPLVGQELSLSDANVENWTELASVIVDETPHDVSVIHNNKIHLGQLVRFLDDNVTKYALLMDRSVVLPDGVCIKVELNEPTKDKDACVDTKFNLTPETRFAVLDSNDCVGGYITFADIIDNIEIPTLCDLIPPPEKRNGELVSQDRILTISGKCNIKAVKQSDIKCK